MQYGAKAAGEAERMAAVVEGISPHVDLAPSDVAIAGAPGTDEQFRRRPHRVRRSRRFTIAQGLRRMWIPLVILTVIAAGGFTVSRLHGIFGSEKSLPYGDTKNEDTKPFNPKILRYEIFGPAGTMADISFFDGNGEPRSADKASLPWSLEFPITAATGIGSIAAQGDADSIGCRILVDGEVKDEKIVSHEVSTFTSCLLKAA